MLRNALLERVAQDEVCTGLSIKSMAGPEVVLLAKTAGYDTIFIDLEHSSLSIATASTLSSTALLAGITPFVRVPSQCGSGFVQRVLDGGALGIIYPHVNTAEQAREAVAMTKFPPQGTRSLTAALPQFLFQRVDPGDVVRQLHGTGSTVFVMIETKEGVGNAAEIAAVPGVDVLLLGANDLSMDMGILGDWVHPSFQSALRDVAGACRAHGKTFGLSGIYAMPHIVQAAVRELGARYVLGHSEMGLMAVAMNKNADLLRRLQ